MVGENGRKSLLLSSESWSLKEDILRDHIKSAAAGKTNLTADQLVDILCSAFPLCYPHRDREHLAGLVAKITPLPYTADAPPPVIKKRRKIDEPQSSSRQNEILTPPVSATPREFGDSDGEFESDEIVNKWPMFRDLQLMDSMIDELIREVIRPLHLLKLLSHLGIEPSPRVLLHGPPGCGKTTLARAIANEARVPLYEISAAAFMSGVSDAPEEIIQELFSTAYTRTPSIVLIDELDAMTSKTGSLQKEIAPRIVNQLIACMDEPYRFIKYVHHNAEPESTNDIPGYVLVIGVTNKIDTVDPVLRRRFDREIVIAAPDELTRFNILSSLTLKLKVDVDFDLAKIARCTLGFVAGDLVALAKKAGSIAVSRIMDARTGTFSEQRVGFPNKNHYRFSGKEMKKLTITMGDFVEAAKMVQPSSEIERFSTTPNTKWDDVGGLQSLKSEFKRLVVGPIKFPAVYKDLGLNLKTTFFLYGPSGCGKTLVVEALANEAGAKLIHMKGPELVKDYGDQCAVVLRIIFSYASTCSPCILFFDEVEAITLCCDENPSPLFKQFLTELDDAKQKSGVYVICATNRPRDKNHLRLTRGKFDEFLHVSFPTLHDKLLILKALARNKPLDANVDLIALSKACVGFNGADLSALMKEAAKAAVDQATLSRGECSSPWTMKNTDFKSALKKISPSTSLEQMKNCNLFNSDVYEMMFER